MIVDIPETRSCSPSIIDIIRSSWGINDWDGGWVWEGRSSEDQGDDASASGYWEELGAEVHFPMGEARERVFDLLFGVMVTLFFALFTNEWTMLLCKDCMEIRPWQGKTTPFLGGWIPLRRKIFMMRLQNGRHVLAIDLLAVLPKI